MYIALSKAVAQAHSRLFPDEPYKDLQTLQLIALALSDLIPIYRWDTHQELTAPELVAERFSPSAMELLVVSKRRFEAALETLQVASLDPARASLTTRRPVNARR